MSNGTLEKPKKVIRHLAMFARVRTAVVVCVALAMALLGVCGVQGSTALAYSETPTVIASGDHPCGTIRWELDSTGTLTISGTGSIYVPENDVIFQNQPWYPYMEQITHIVIGEGITSIETRGLCELRYAESIYIPSTVTRIGKNAIAANVSLTSVTFAPNSQLETLESYAFAGDPLHEVRIPASVQRIDANALGDVERIAFEPGADPQTLSSYDKGIQSWSYGWQVFKGRVLDEHGYGYLTHLKQIEIPAFITSIDEKDFNVFEQLESVVVGSRELYEVLAQAFAETDVSILGINADSQTGLHYLDMGDSILVQGYDGDGETLVIPASIDGKPVTGIGPHAFGGADSLRIITLPESITVVEEGAFSLVPHLQMVRVPTLDLHDAVVQSGVDGTLISGSLVDDSSGLRYLLSGSDVVVTGRDNPCSALFIPEAIDGRPVTVLLGTFSNCTQMTSVSLPSTLRSISSGAFENCVMLNSVEIPASVISIDSGAFSGCISLAQVVFASGSKLESLGNGVFRSCSSLASLKLPATVMSIGSGAFAGCDSLAAVAMAATSGSLSARCFSPLTVPDACLSTFVGAGSVDGHWAYGQLAYSAKDACWYRTDAAGEQLSNTPPVFRKVGAKAYPCDASGEVLRDDNQLVARLYPDGNLVFQLGNWEDPAKLDSGYHSIMSGNGLMWFRGSLDHLGDVAELTRNVQLDSSLRAVDATCFMNGNLDNLFAGLCNAESIEGFANLAGVQASSAANLFNGCASLYELDLRALDMSRVVNAEAMFDGCDALVSLKLGYLWKNAGNGTRCAVFSAEAFSMDSVHARYAKGAAIPDGSGEYRMGNGSIPIQLVDVIMDKPIYDYTGKAITPAIELRYGNTVLVKGKDYAVSYDNNILPGKAKINIQGMGAFGGGVTASFTIQNVATAIGDKVIYRTKEATYAFVVTAVARQSGGNTVPTEFKLLSVQVESSKTTKLVLPSTCTIGSVVVDVTAVGSKLGGNFRNVSSVVIGAKVTVIAAKAFAKAPKVKKLLLKTKRLRKATNSLKGSKVKTVTAKCKLAKAKRKSYRKMFEKKSGRKGVKFSYKP